MKRVVGVGHSCLDKICTVENYPREDDSTHITHIAVQGGGAVATALVALSRLGVKASFIGNAGYDGTTDEIVKLFQADGVDTSLISRRTDCVGLESFVMVNPLNRSRTKFPQRDTNPPILWDKEKEDAIASASAIHLDGTNWENAVSAAERARKHGVLVSLDGCSMQKDNEKNRILASMADILIMNNKYPLRVSGKDDYSSALLEIASWGPKVVVATLGEKGSMAVVDGEVVEYGIYREENALDTTGCGDVFHGAFLASWLEEEDLDKAISFASASSSLKTRKMGGRAGIPRREEVLELIGNQLLRQQKRRNI
ncbi:MAG: carbohydrate kinase family protein [Candidatus Ornithospirochaeta sp.]